TRSAGAAGAAAGAGGAAAGGASAAGAVGATATGVAAAGAAGAATAAAGAAAAAGAPTATGTAGGATTTGAACEMSTSRRGSAWPGRTRSARTTLRVSSSFANRGAYRMYMTIRKITMAAPRTDSGWAIVYTQPALFSVGVVDGSIGVCATAAVTVEAMNTAAPANTTRSLRDVFIRRIVATSAPGGNRGVAGARPPLAATLSRHRRLDRAADHRVHRPDDRPPRGTGLQPSEERAQDRQPGGVLVASPADLVEEDLDPAAVMALGDPDVLLQGRERRVLDRRLGGPGEVGVGRRDLLRRGTGIPRIAAAGEHPVDATSTVVAARLHDALGPFAQGAVGI